MSGFVVLPHTEIQERLNSIWSGVASDVTAASYVAPQKYTDEEFALKYLKGSALFPESGPGRWFDPPPVHYKLTDLTSRMSRALIQLPREFAKSTKFTVVRPLRLICESRDVRGVIVSGRADAAERFAGAVRHQLESNERLIADYGTFQGKGKWTDSQFTVLRAGAYPQPTIQAIGRGGQIVGGRYNFAILDDTEDYDATRTDTNRKKTFEWFLNDVVPIVMAGGFLYIIQTPQHEADLVGQLRTKKGVWKLINIPAEFAAPKGEADPMPDPALPPERKVPDIARKSNWPEKWPIYWTDCAVKRGEEKGHNEDRLASIAEDACAECPVYNASKGDTNGVGCLTGKRFEIGRVFYRLQYLVDIKAFGGDVFRPEYWRYYTPQQIEWNANLKRWIYYEPAEGETPLRFNKKKATRHAIEVYAGVDPAIAEEEDQAPDATHSRFAMVIVGYVRKLRRRLVLYYFNQRLDFPSQKKVIVEQFTTWSPTMVGIEDVAYQKALRQDIVSEHHLPIRRLQADSDKFRRLVMLSPEFEAHNYYVRAEEEFAEDTSTGERIATGRLQCVMTEYTGQFESFPKGALRDLMDATHYAERLIGRRKMFDGWDDATEHPREKEAREEAERAAQANPQHWTTQQLLAGSGIVRV